MLQAHDRWTLMRRLRAKGWRVRLKPHLTKADQLPLQSDDKVKPCQTASDAICAALMAYRRTLVAFGDRGEPCRAAVRAYRNICPDDQKASERVVAALVLAIRHYPRTFAGSHHLPA